MLVHLTDIPPLRGPHTHTAVGGGRHNQSLALGKVDGDNATEVSTPGQEEGRGACHWLGTHHMHTVVTDVPQLWFKRLHFGKNITSKHSVDPSMIQPHTMAS